MKAMRAIGFTYEDFRDMAKKKHPDAIDFSSYENIHAEQSIEIMYPVDSFRYVRVDFLDLVKEMYPDLKISDNAYYIRPLKQDGNFAVIVDVCE